ncbi:MAG: hypothetical protein HKP37_09070 [Boseongicola sp.]|nr:hypothetical protein [Boseongicola sp.]
MAHVVQTNQLLAEGILTQSQANEIARRSRDTMLSLVVNILLMGGIIAASLGFVFWIADPFGVAALGLGFFLAGTAILFANNPLYRMLGNAAGLVGAGMLISGASIELLENYRDIAEIVLTLSGAAIAALAATAFRFGPQSLRFITGCVLVIGLAPHLVGLGIWAEDLITFGWTDGIANWPKTLFLGYATLAAVVTGIFLNARLVTALAIVPFAQMLDTGTGYFHAAYVFYSPEATLTILQMGVATAIGAWAMTRTPDHIGRHAGIFAIMAVVVGNLAFLVGSLWGDEIGASFFRADAPGYADFENWSEYRAAYDLWEEQFIQISEHVFSVVWAVLLIAGAWLAAATHRRGLFNASITFLGIHAYTQVFETFSDEPMVYALGGLAAIPAAWGLWRLNKKMFDEPAPV